MMRREDPCPCHGTGELHSGHTIECWQLTALADVTAAAHGWLL